MIRGQLTILYLGPLGCKRHGAPRQVAPAWRVAFASQIASRRQSPERCPCGSLPISSRRMRLKNIALYAVLFGVAYGQSATQGRGGDVSNAGFAGCGVTRAGAKLVFASGASPATPCIYAINDSPVSFTTPSEIAIAGAGSGAAVIFISSTGVSSITYNGSLKLSITGGKMGEGQVPAPSFPPGSLPLAAVTVKDGQWEKLQDRRPSAGSRQLVT